MAATSRSNEGLKKRQVLEEQLKICGFRNNGEVTDLYLGEKAKNILKAPLNGVQISDFRKTVQTYCFVMMNQGLREVPDLSRFQILRCLWLNNNKIQNLPSLKHNCCLTELYLNDNEIRSIAGALRHLHSLNVLLLHNNQLKNLEMTVKELERMQNLQTLNLFNNPLSQDCRYHLYVIYHIPWITLLDRKGCEFGNHLVKIPFENPEDAVDVRAMNRSIMEYSTFDWGKMPTSEEKRVGSNPEKQPERLTFKFK